MTKADFVTRVAETTGKTKAATEETIAIAFQVIAEELAEQGEVAWPGFGRFKTIMRQPREGRNPNTGEAIHIEGGWAPKFTPAQGLRDAIKG
jgi:DNA-binding protein HU-beta